MRSVTYGVWAMKSRSTTQDPSAGGMMRFGIPAYRLPRNVLDAEIARIQAMGVQIVLNRRIDDLASIMLDERFDSAFLAIGAHIARRTTIPAGDVSRILDAVAVLRDMEALGHPFGRRVIVYGGGNTAIDAARTARRLGAQTRFLSIGARARRWAHMTLKCVRRWKKESSSSRLSTVRAADNQAFVVEKMELDGTGFPQPTGELETIQADSLILAIGQDVDLSFLRNVKGLEFQGGQVMVNEWMMTGCPGVFAGGDMVPCELHGSVAAGHGRESGRVYRHLSARCRCPGATVA